MPLLALVAFLAPGGETVTTGQRLVSVAVGLAAIAALVAAGRWLLNPFFRILAMSRAREVMTAAALLVVLGAALLMQEAGLSMAMGAFLAGVMLSESAYRHQLEADIEAPGLASIHRVRKDERRAEEDVWVALVSDLTLPEGHVGAKRAAQPEQSPESARADGRSGS